MVKVDLSGHKLFVLANSDWQPGDSIFPAAATQSKYFSKDEASLTMIRLYTSPIRAAWASVCWKHSSSQPWIVKVDVSADLAVFRKSSGSEVYWTAAVPSKCIVEAANWFSWATAWPNELAAHFRPIEEYLIQEPG